MSEVPFQTIDTVSLDGEQVLVRADLNVPMNSNGTILDDDRIQGSLETIQRLVEQDAKVVVCAHRGRPGADQQADLGLGPVAARMAELLDQDVQFIPEVIGSKVRQATARLTRGSVALLDNLRFHPGESANNIDFARSLAEDTHTSNFVQDGFGVAHRRQASTHAITEVLPSVGGLLLAREYQQITSAINTPERPLTVVMGGSKVSDKVELVNRFIEQADQIIIGGAMANTFLAYRGIDVGNSRVEVSVESLLDTIYESAAQKVGDANVDDFICLPTDLAFEDDSGERIEHKLGQIPSAGVAYDIGTDSIQKATELIGESGTVIWNGTVGLAENPAFALGSLELARHFSQTAGLRVIVGGGDTGAYVRSVPGAIEGIDLVSRGGGASLELMATGHLPGIDVLPTR